MGTTQPIKNKKDITALKEYFLTEDFNLRNYTLITMGINTALRISDILALRWKDVYNTDEQSFRSHLNKREQKTGKSTCIALNQSVIQALTLYRNSISVLSEQAFIFYGKTPDRPLCRSQAYRIIKNACHQLRLPDNISCHSLRKTFGYQALQAGVTPAILMLIYNHSSFQVTKRYLGIDQDDKDNIFLEINCLLQHCLGILEIPDSSQKISYIKSRFTIQAIRIKSIKNPLSTRLLSLFIRR